MGLIQHLPKSNRCETCLNGLTPENSSYKGVQKGREYYLVLGNCNDCGTTKVYERIDMSEKKKTLKVEIKNAYGKDFIYPKNEIADLICKLTGKKTLNHKDLLVLRQLGFKIEHTSEIPDIFS